MLESHRRFLNWQRSRFVESISYRRMPQDWKDEREREERLIVRGPGRVGSPECNILFRVEGQDAEQCLDDLFSAQLTLRTLLILTKSLMHSIRTKNRKEIDFSVLGGVVDLIHGEEDE